MVDVKGNPKKLGDNLGHARASPNLGFPAKPLGAVDESLGKDFHIAGREFRSRARMGFLKKQPGIFPRSGPPPRDCSRIYSKDPSDFDLLGPFLQSSDSPVADNLQFFARTFWTHGNPPFASKVHLPFPPYKS